MNRDISKGLRLKNTKGLNAAEIADVIEKGYLAKRRPSSPWTQKKTFSPSTIAYGHGTCPRYWTTAFNGLDTFTDSTDALGVANMSYGSHAHDEIQEIFEQAGLLVEAEQEITIQDPPIRGYLDAIVNWKGEEVVCEIKTTRAESFAFKETSRKPSANHLIQLLIYLKATGIQRGFLLYMNKNDQTFLVIPVELDTANEKIINDVFEWLRTVRAAYENNQTPKRPFRKNKETGLPSNKICNACPVQAVCFAGPEGEVAIARMEVPAL